MSTLNPQQVLLQALVSGEGYAVELIDRVKEKTNGEVCLAQSSIYPALRSLERQGFVIKRLGEPLPRRGGRRRTYYALTAEGRRAALTERDAILALNPVTVGM